MSSLVASGHASVEHHFGKHAIVCLVLATMTILIDAYERSFRVVRKGPELLVSPSGEIATLESHCISQGSFLDNSGELFQTMLMIPYSILVNSHKKTSKRVDEGNAPTGLFPCQGQG